MLFEKNKKKADFLGDRIAIMSKGALKCCGSPLYLKSKFGSGYSLILTKKRLHERSYSTKSSTSHSSLHSEVPEIENKEEKQTSGKIIDLVKRFIPNARLQSNINSEISFILPAADSDKFSSLFECLEVEKESLSIVNVGVSVTTIEDVFLK
jgi:ABC-type multidrug transport system ATPase subunit